MTVRSQVQQVLTYNVAGHHNSSNQAGDWNAAYLATDRWNRVVQSPADRDHLQLLQTLQIQPANKGLEADSRQHTFYAEGQQQQHSRVDDFTWSKSPQSCQKAAISVLKLKAVTWDSDHHPLLADLPLDNIIYVPFGPKNTTARQDSQDQVACNTTAAT